MTETQMRRIAMVERFLTLNRTVPEEMLEFMNQNSTTKAAALLMLAYDPAACKMNAELEDEIFAGLQLIVEHFTN